MAYDPNVLRRASARLEEEKRRREDERELLRRQTYAREPRLAQLDRRLQGTMAELVAASLRKGENAGDAVRAIRDKNLELQQERAVLLGALGLPEDALDDKPACPKCGDTGWRGAQMCDCLRSLCTQEQIRELSKLLDLGEQSFDTFRLDYYSQSVWPGRGTSPRDNMDLVYEVCLNYAQKFGRFYFKNLFLSGAPDWARPSCPPASPARCPSRGALWCTTPQATSSPSLRPGSSSGMRRACRPPWTRPGGTSPVTCSFWTTWAAS